MDNDLLTLQDLADATGVEPRTIRSYVEKGIIPGPDSLGRGARYPRESLDRLKVLQLLRDADRDCRVQTPAPKPPSTMLRLIGSACTGAPQPGRIPWWREQLP